MTYIIYNSRIKGYLSHDPINLDLCYNYVIDDFTVYFEDYNDAIKFCNEDESIKMVSGGSIINVKH